MDKFGILVTNQKKDIHSIFIEIVKDQAFF